MNVEHQGPKRPRLYLPKALLAAGPAPCRSPTLSTLELRAAVTEMVG